MTRDLTIGSGGAELAVRDYEGGGPGIVLIHGLSSNLEIWSIVAPLLSERFHVVSYDQRNHGLSSEADDFSFDALTSDLDAVIDAVGMGEPFVVGHSWGASVALHHAAGGECPGVVCVDGGVIDMQDMGQSWQDTEKLLRPPDLEGTADELLRRIRAEQDVLPWEAAESVFRRAFPEADDGVMRRRLPVEKHMRIVRELWTQRLSELYEKIACPVTLVLASGIGAGPREEGFVAVKREGVRRLLDRGVNVRVEWLPSVHDVPLLHPSELASLISEALN